jgi:hypothetical protein
MVVSSLIQIRRIKPNIDSNIVLFTLFMGILLVLAGAGADDELGADGAAGVAVAGEAQFAALGRAPGGEVDLGGLVQVPLVLGEVPAANQEQLL